MGVRSDMAEVWMVGEICAEVLRFVGGKGCILYSSCDEQD